MNTYARGTSVQVSVEFLDLSKAAFDPATVICQIKTPAGTETTYTYGDDDELVRDSAGKYHLWVDATGDLRIKSSAPGNDTDGAIVGTQS